MKTDDLRTSSAQALTCQQTAAIAVAAALEGGLTTSGNAASGNPTLTFQFQGEEEHQAACDAWRNYALALVDVSAPPASTAAHRATAKLGLALFGDPTLNLMELADMVASVRVATPAALLSANVSEKEENKNGRR